ncbi:hypothetical protein F1880_006653 [Penicillium rolfsii]|nr:hypothetical protein F1880_006653 [Penicillium rolfsii]
MSVVCFMNLFGPKNTLGTRWESGMATYFTRYEKSIEYSWFQAIMPGLGKEVAMRGEKDD